MSFVVRFFHYELSFLLNYLYCFLKYLFMFFSRYFFSFNYIFILCLFFKNIVKSKKKNFYFIFLFTFTIFLKRQYFVLNFLNLFFRFFIKYYLKRCKRFELYTVSCHNKNLLDFPFCLKLPSRKTLVSVLRSPFIYKKAFEQYGIVWSFFFFKFQFFGSFFFLNLLAFLFEKFFIKYTFKKILNPAIKIYKEKIYVFRFFK